MTIEQQLAERGLRLAGLGSGAGSLLCGIMVRKRFGPRIDNPLLDEYHKSMDEQIECLVLVLRSS